jgi:hypothetical protein
MRQRAAAAEMAEAERVMAVDENARAAVPLHGIPGLAHGSAPQFAPRPGTMAQGIGGEKAMFCLTMGLAKPLIRLILQIVVSIS